ncbi:hypothetical protein OZX56_06525 [Lactobacillus sp. ESL0684]|nr:hypothetical protein [Lactobacillus sp. ESL0684]WEV43190.1 hypothetical protein OZX56_06525 [Lactobacillus sp. ESL0684]
MTEEKLQAPEHKLNQRDLWQMFLRLNTMRITLNYETLQGVGFM